VLARVNAGTDVQRLIEDEEVGRVYVGHSLNELKRLAEELIDNETLRLAMSERGKRLGRSMFSPETAARQILAQANPESVSGGQAGELSRPE
jgi:ABC-type molybdate transport system ATPase subunit